MAYNVCQMCQIFQIWMLLMTCIVNSSPLITETDSTPGTCITIGAIAEGSAPMADIPMYIFGFNVTVRWTYVDTAELYNIFRAVQRYDNNGDIDIIVLFDYDSRISPNPDILTPKHKQILKLRGKRDDLPFPNELKEILVDKGVSRVLKDDSYCEKSFSSSSMTEWFVDMPVEFGPRALVHLVVHELKWRTVIIIHDNETETEARYLVDSLSRQRVLLTIYNADTLKSLHGTLSHIYKTTMRIQPELNFIVIGRPRTAVTLLHTANHFDEKDAKQKTLLNQFSRWLVAVYGHTSELSKTLHACANDLDNVVIVAFPDYVGPTSQSFTGVVEEVFGNVHFRREEYKDNSTGLLNKTLIVEHLSRTTLFWNPVTRCTGFKIDTLFWTKNGRGFSTVGLIYTSGKIALQFQLFPNTNYGYNKRKFLVSTLEYDPFVIKHNVSIGSGSEQTFNVTYEGFTMDLLKELARVLNFTYELIEPEDQSWGGLVIEHNFTFNGLVGQLQREVFNLFDGTHKQTRKFCLDNNRGTLARRINIEHGVNMECDLVAAPISIQPSREEVVDFSYPFFYEYTTVIVKKPDLQTIKWRTLVDPFKSEVLVAIGLSLAVVTILVYLFEKYNPFYDTPEHMVERSRNGGLNYLHNSFWYMYGALLCQGGVHLPDSTAGRTFVSCWWLTCIVVVGIYCGNLIAFLTFTKEKPPFNTLAEMVEKKSSYEWGTLGATNWENIFLSSNQSIFKKIGDRIRELNKTDPLILSRGVTQHLNRVKEGGYAWIGDKTSIEITMAKECQLLKIKEEFLPMSYAFGFPENSPHNLIFSEQIMKLHEGGLLQIWKRKWWPKSNFCASPSVPQAKPISLIDVQSAFYVCAAGTIFGTIAFITEHLVFKFRKSMRDKEKHVVRCISNVVLEESLDIVS